MNSHSQGYLSIWVSCVLHVLLCKQSPLLNYTPHPLAFSSDTIPNALNRGTVRTKIYQLLESQLYESLEAKQVGCVTMVQMCYLASWLRKPGGSMPHSQGFSIYPYPELNEPNFSY